MSERRINRCITSYNCQYENLFNKLGKISFDNDDGHLIYLDCNTRIGVKQKSNDGNNIEYVLAGTICDIVIVQSDISHIDFDSYCSRDYTENVNVYYLLFDNIINVPEYTEIRKFKNYIQNRNKQEEKDYYDSMMKLGDEDYCNNMIELIKKYGIEIICDYDISKDIEYPYDSDGNSLLK